MTDDMQSIRSDLAFLKTMAADAGPLPRIVGWQFAAPGLIYGPATILAWAIVRGLVPLSQKFAGALGLWPTLIYLPVLAVLVLATRRPPAGTATRAMAGAWSGVGLTTLSVIAVIFIAGAKLHVPGMWQVWTSICFSLWGAGWWAFAVLRRDKRWFVVAVGSLLNAVINACLIGTPEQILGTGIGILCWLTGPGLVIALQPRPRA
jgi:hypothetical protein